MANKNYTNYSKPQKEKPVESAVPEMESTVDEKVVPDNSQERLPGSPEPVIGTVANCVKLNIREEANKESEILCVINKGEKVEIIEEESTDDFYAVCYGKDKSVSVYGFCMKDYIKLDK